MRLLMVIRAEILVEIMFLGKLLKYWRVRVAGHIIFESGMYSNDVQGFLE